MFFLFLLEEVPASTTPCVISVCAALTQSANSHSAANGHNLCLLLATKILVQLDV
jgi:hypothetical protein